MSRGPTTPYQLDASKPLKPCSSMVGMAGNPLARFTRVWAMPCIFPARTWAVAAVMVSKLKSIWPPMRSVCMGPEPL